MTRLHVTGEVEEFAAAAQGYLLADPVAHTVQLTVLAQLRGGHGSPQPPRFGWVTDDAGEVVAAASWTPPFPVALATGDPSYAEDLAPGFGDADGVIGPDGAAEAFAAALGRHTTVVMRELQYRLDRVTMPPSPPGGPRRVAGRADVALAARWFEAFVTDTGVRALPGSGPDAIATRLARGGLWFWSCGERPVCMAGYLDTAGSVPRIGLVYTPPEQRGHGYAAALTAALAHDRLAHGARAVTLFTDAANPTSNGVYRRIGFEQVGRIVDLRFSDAGAGSASVR